MITDTRTHADRIDAAAYLAVEWDSPVPLEELDLTGVQFALDDGAGWTGDAADALTDAIRSWLRDHAYRTRRDALACIAAVIDAGDADSDDYDVDAIGDAVISVAHGWYLITSDDDAFWDVVAAHARGAQ